MTSTHPPAAVPGTCGYELSAGEFVQAVLAAQRPLEDRSEPDGRWPGQ